jgi:hypothetical protein
MADPIAGAGVCPAAQTVPPAEQAQGKKSAPQIQPQPNHGVEGELPGSREGVGLRVVPGQSVTVNGRDFTVVSTNHTSVPLDPLCGEPGDSPNTSGPQAEAEAITLKDTDGKRFTLRRNYDASSSDSLRAYTLQGPDGTATAVDTQKIEYTSDVKTLQEANAKVARDAGGRLQSDFGVTHTARRVAGRFGSTPPKLHD